MPGLGDSLGILEVKEMKGRPRQVEARELLERLRDQASRGTTARRSTDRIICCMYNDVTGVLLY